MFAVITDFSQHIAGLGTKGSSFTKVPAKFILDNLNRIVKVYWVVYQNSRSQRYSNCASGYL